MRPKRRHLMAEINVVPYIDVMLVLLVIFMITAPLLTQGIQVTLPEAQAKKLPESEKPPLIISVDAHGLYYLNAGDHPNEPMDQKQLLIQVNAYQKLAREKGYTRQVYVKGDRHVSYGKVVQAMVLLQRAGVDHVGLLTKQPSRRMT